MIRSVIWLVCISLSTATASECEVCFSGKCLAPNQLKAEGSGEDITASMSAIDINNNILYAVRNTTIQAIHLDDNTVSTIATKEQNRIAHITVDQVTSEVYYSYVRSASMYKYIPSSGETQKIRQRIGRHLWIHNETLYLPGLAKGLTSYKGTSSKSVDTFKSDRVLSLVFDKLGNMYVGTAGYVYKAKPNESKTVVASSAYRLRVDGSGDVYLVDTKKHLIYTEQLNVVGAFGQKYYNYISYFKFDKNDNIIAKSSDAGVQSFIYFKYTSDECTIKNTDSTPYITNISSPKGEEAPKKVEDDPNYIPKFGD